MGNEEYGFRDCDDGCGTHSFILYGTPVNTSRFRILCFKSRALGLGFADLGFGVWGLELRGLEFISQGWALWFCV